MDQESSEFDLNVLRATTQGDPEQERRLLTLYFSTAEHRLEDMANQAGEEGDQELWDDYTHDLQNASATVGAVGMARLSQLARGQSSATQRRALLERLHREYASLKPHMLQLIF